MGMSAISPVGGSISVMQTASTTLKDQKSKSIQTEISSVQQQIQRLSSDEELSVNEQNNERKKLQREKASLDTELRQHQDELLRSQKRQDRLAKLQEERNPKTEEKAEDDSRTSAAVSDTEERKGQPAEEEQALQPGTVIAQNTDGTVVLKEVMKQAESAETDTESKPVDNTETAAVQEEVEPAAADTDPLEDARPTAKEMRAMVAANSSMQLATQQGRLVAKTDDGIAILKSEIKLDESRGTDTERKQMELEKMEKQRNREQSFQFSILGEASDTMRSALEQDAPEKNPFVEPERAFYISGLDAAQDEQQGFLTGTLKAVSTF